MSSCHRRKIPVQADSVATEAVRSFYGNRADNTTRLILDLIQAENVGDGIIPLFAGQREHRHTRVGRGESDQQRGARHPRGGREIWKSGRPRVWRANLPRDRRVTRRANLLSQGKAFLWVAYRLRATEIDWGGERQKS